MTFTVEDGTGLAAANSYVSIAEADAYFTLRANAVWTGTDAVKQAALVRATDYVDATYQWRGCISSATQALSFPRYAIYDDQNRDLSNTVPQRLKDAVCELAVASLGGELLANTSRENYAIREKVGQVEVEYSDHAPTGAQYKLADRLLAGLTLGSKGGMNVPVIRA